MLSKLCVQVAWVPIFLRLNFLFMEDVSEFFADQVLLLLIKNVDFLFGVVKPGMVKNFLGAKSFANILFEHVLHQVSCQLRGYILVLDLLLIELVS